MKTKIMRHLLSLVALPAFALSVATAVVAPSVALAASETTNLTLGDGANSAQGDGTSSCLFGGAGCADGETGIFKTITNVLLFVIGAVSVIMLIIGGIRYTVSQGDSSAVQSAKNTILYAIIGIVVAILAYAIVNFVITSFITPAE